MGGFWSVPKDGTSNTQPLPQFNSPQKQTSNENLLEDDDALVIRLEEIANEFVNNEAFNVNARKYGLFTDCHYSKDLPLEDLNLDDGYYSSEEKAMCEKPHPAQSGRIPEPPPFKWQRGTQLGVGSFGKVYLGLNLDTGELIAVKLVELVGDINLHRAEIEALQQEISVLRTLQHENIVRYLGCSVEDNTFNIFLEYIPGGSIASVIKKFSSLNESVIRRYTKQILMGLEYLHSHQIIHRDIKGANILVDNKGVIKLADFGASRKLEGLLARDGCPSLKGTAYWMAPEVIRQTGYGRQADIWSLGCTVVEMATGKPPWFDQYPDQVAALFNIATNDLPPPIPDFLSSEAKNFLTLCFQRNPKNRPNARRLLQHPFILYADTPQPRRLKDYPRLRSEPIFPHSRLLEQKPPKMKTTPIFSSSRSQNQNEPKVNSPHPILFASDKKQTISFRTKAPKEPINTSLERPLSSLDSLSDINSTPEQETAPTNSTTLSHSAHSIVTTVNNNTNTNTNNTIREREIASSNRSSDTENNSDSDSDTTGSKSEAESSDDENEIPTDLSVQQKQEQEQSEKTTPASQQTNEELSNSSLQTDTNISVPKSEDSPPTSNALTSSKRLLRTTSKTNPIIRETSTSDISET